MLWDYHRDGNMLLDSHGDVTELGGIPARTCRDKSLFSNCCRMFDFILLIRTMLCYQLIDLSIFCQPTAVQSLIEW